MGLDRFIDPDPDTTDLKVFISPKLLRQLDKALGILEPPRREDVLVPSFLVLDPLVSGAERPTGDAEVLAVDVIIVGLEHMVELLLDDTRMLLVLFNCL